MTPSEASGSSSPLTRREFVDGLAAWAVMYSESGESEATARAHLLQLLGANDRVLLLEAIESVNRLPQPPSLPADRADRLDRMSALVGAQTTVEQLAAALRAREWLQRLHDDLGDGSTCSQDSVKR